MLDDQIYKNIEFLKENNPEFNYQLFDETSQLQFLKQYFPEKFLAIYNSFGKGYDTSKIDFFRSLLLYHFGGVYLDIKSTFIKPFKEFIKDNDTFLVSHWPKDINSQYANWGNHSELPGGEFIFGVIISEAKSLVLQNVINRVVSNIEQYRPLRDGVGQLAVLRLTGPITYTISVNEYSDQQMFREIDFFEFGYKPSIFNSVDTHTKMAKLHYATRTNPIIKRGIFVSLLTKSKYSLMKLLKLI